MNELTRDPKVTHDRKIAALRALVDDTDQLAARAGDVRDLTPRTRLLLLAATYTGEQDLHDATGAFSCGHTFTQDSGCGVCSFISQVSKLDVPHVKKLAYFTDGLV